MVLVGVETDNLFKLEVLCYIWCVVMVLKVNFDVVKYVMVVIELLMI